jgi:hypothetical protein
MERPRGLLLGFLGIALPAFFPRGDKYATLIFWYRMVEAEPEFAEPWPARC